MDLSTLCMGCLKEKGEAASCPHCGYEESTTAESPLYLAPRTVLEGKYLIGRVLGQGGFGITYLAWDINLNVKVAIKEYFPQQLVSRAVGHSIVSVYTGNLADQFEYGLDKFLQEARTLAQFEGHPNIVSIRDFFKANGTAYFVMSYVEGITLKGYLAQRGGKLPIDQARGIIIPVMDALREVHSVNILHRDISPDNIIINQKGQIMLLDFGAARQAIGEKGRSLSIILKPGYAPEEQYRSKGHQGPWTDIYAVAATYYHLLTGTPPPESLERMTDDRMEPPTKLGVSISDLEEQALLKALAVKAGDRFQTIGEFQAALLAEKPAVKTIQESGWSKGSAGEGLTAFTTPPAAADDKTKKKKAPLAIIFAAAAIVLVGIAVFVFLQSVDVDQETASVAEEEELIENQEEQQEDNSAADTVQETDLALPGSEEKDEEPETKTLTEPGDREEEKEQKQGAAAPDSPPAEESTAAEEPVIEADPTQPTISYQGGTYTGQLDRNMPHGQGTWTHPDGSSYQGGWRNGLRSGKGTMIWSNGNTYSGDWNIDNMQGWGTLTKPNGEKYVGNFKAGKIHGQGTYTWSDGSKYVGEFEDGLRHGKGTMTEADGTVRDGSWLKDRFIR